MNTPAYGQCKLEHSATKATLDSFAALTNKHAMQSDGDGGWLLLGNCVSCHTTLAVEISLARGNAVRGEINLEESERLAKEMIR